MNLMAIFKQSTTQVPADKAGAAGNKEFQCATPISVS
jgi:hypothetical protein